MQTHTQSVTDPDDNDANLVAMWLTRDPARWIAGVMAGLFAGIVMIAFGMVLSMAVGADPLSPLKIAALPILGGSATALEFNVATLLLGFVVIEVLSAFLGFVYAHFTGTNSLPALLAMGLVWGIFSWIFIDNLFINSFKAVFAAHLASGALFPVSLVFGVSLSSVAFFDQMVRGKRH